MSSKSWIGLDLFLQIHVVGGEPRVEPLDRRHAGAQRGFVTAALQRDSEYFRNQPDPFDDRDRPSTRRSPRPDHERTDDLIRDDDRHGQPAALLRRPLRVARLDGRVVGAGDGHHLALRQPVEQPAGRAAAFPERRFSGRPRVDGADGLAVGKLDQRAGVDVDRPADALQRIDDRQGNLLDVQPREPGGQRGSEPFELVQFLIGFRTRRKEL